MTTTRQEKTPESSTTGSTEQGTVEATLSAWDKVLQGAKVSFARYLTVVTADFRLSVKALVVASICIMTLVCLIMLIWVTLLIGLTYGLAMLGVHWLWCLLLVLAVNFIALAVVKRTFISAVKSIEMKTSAALLCSAKQHNTKATPQ